MTNEQRTLGVIIEILERFNRDADCPGMKADPGFRRLRASLRRNLDGSDPHIALVATIDVLVEVMERCALEVSEMVAEERDDDEEIQ